MGRTVAGRKVPGRKVAGRKVPGGKAPGKVPGRKAQDTAAAGPETGGAPARKFTVRTATQVVKTGFSHPRFLLAVKAALAVAIAWFLAHYTPGVTDEYPYYAPLGALVSMYPTLMGSVRNGLQTLAGLVIGVLLASAVLVFGESTFISLPIVVGIGVLVSGYRRLGAGTEYVPVAALLVLVIGGGSSDVYQIGYVVQMALGVAVGIGVNVFVFPPLFFNTAVLELSRFRRVLAAYLDDVSAVLKEDWPPEEGVWENQNRSLLDLARDVRTAVHKADDSRKGNPRTRFHQRDLATDFADLAALDAVTFHIRDATDVLSHVVHRKTWAAELPPELAPMLSEVFSRTAGSLRAWDGLSCDPGASEVVVQGRAAVHALLTAMDERKDTALSTLSPAASMAITLLRILDIIDRRIQAGSDAGPGDPAKGRTDDDRGSTSTGRRDDDTSDGPRFGSAADER